MSLFSMGSDPEFMLVDSNGKYRSAIGIVHGTKEDKISLGNGSFAFYDNVLVEVNVKAANNRAGVIENFGDCFKRLAKLVGNLKVVPQASNTYDLSECQHPDAQRFGCDPEYCIYVLDDNGFISRMDPPLVDPKNPFRTGGGHIHIGNELCLPWCDKHVDVIQMLDLFVGMASIFIDHDPTSSARRNLYGGAGTFRAKEQYGLEYRSLSNFWLASPRLVGLVYDLVEFVLDFVESNDYKSLVFDPATVREIINKGHRSVALNTYATYQNVMPEKLFKDIMALSEPVSFDFYKEWNLK